MDFEALKVWTCLVRVFAKEAGHVFSSVCDIDETHPVNRKFLVPFGSVSSIVSEGMFLKAPKLS